MNADERTRELIRMREKALHDEASLLEEARKEGEAKKEAEIIQKMRAEGMTDEEINSILFS